MARQLTQAEARLLDDVRRIMEKGPEKFSEAQLGEMITCLASLVCGMIHHLNGRRSRREGH